MRKMKDSGIEWIGEIPEGWKQNTVFQIFTQVKNQNINLQNRYPCDTLCMLDGTIQTLAKS